MGHKRRRLPSRGSIVLIEEDLIADHRGSPAGPHHDWIGIRRGRCPWLQEDLHLIEARKLTTPCEWAEIDRLCRLTGEVDFTSSAPCSGTAQWCGNVFMHDNPAVCPFLEDHRPPPVQMR